MNLTYNVIIKRTPYGLIASVPDLDLRIIHNDKELNACLAQHSAISLNDFLELYYDTFLFTLSSRIEEEIYWLAKYLLDAEGYIPYPYTNVEHQSAAKEHCSIRITTAIERGKTPRVDLKIVKSLLKKSASGTIPSSSMIPTTVTLSSESSSVTASQSNPKTKFSLGLQA